jgi:CRISPR/Cas system CSM-associated protein Csm2 small subunit
MFRFIAENDYLMLNSDYETFQKISEFMLNTINEEDKEENCFKYFFGVLHGIFVEDKKSYLDIFINK